MELKARNLEAQRQKEEVSEFLLKIYMYSNNLDEKQKKEEEQLKMINNKSMEDQIKQNQEYSKTNLLSKLKSDVEMRMTKK